MYYNQIIFLTLSMNVILTTCLPHGSGKFRFCGRHLIDALQLVCGHSGYQPPLWDVSTTEKLVNYSELNNDGIATECCYQGCTWKGLSAYCADSHRTIRESVFDGIDFGGLGLGEPIPAAVHDGAFRGKFMAAAPEVGKQNRKKGHVGTKGRKEKFGEKGDEARKERRGRVHNCICERDERPRRKRPARARKVDFENVKRSAPVFGTVSPEYLRLPRTLDEVPEPYRGLSGF